MPAATEIHEAVEANAPPAAQVCPLVDLCVAVAPDLTATKVPPRAATDHVPLPVMVLAVDANSGAGCEVT